MDADVCRLVWYSLCKCAHTIMMSSVVCVCVCVALRWWRRWWWCVFDGVGVGLDAVLCV